MDWFERITGFPEESYSSTQSRLKVQGQYLINAHNGRKFDMGRFSMPNLSELRSQLESIQTTSVPLTVKLIQGDVRGLHQDPDFSGAVFQVASQFNMLEMVGPSVTPEDGVTRYAFDRTQGPACAMAAGAATIYRNYLVPVGGQIGQSQTAQLDGLADLGCHFEQVTDQPISNLWCMRNGYALVTAEGLNLISKYLGSLDEGSYLEVCGMLRVGLQANAEVTDSESSQGPLVTQVFCSALPVAYSQHSPSLWSEFALLVLRASYEATLAIAALNAANGGSRHVLLTLLGGGAFGNRDTWIEDAIRTAMWRHRDSGLCIWLVSYGAPSQSLTAFIAELNAELDLR